MDAPQAYGGDAPMDGSTSGGIPAIPSMFLGNLDYGTNVSDIRNIFERPLPGIGDGMDPMEVEKVDLKRGFCFVYLKQNFKSLEERNAVYTYAERVNGMHVDRVSKQLRAEFARGDGRIKRKEESRQGRIEPNDTLFVVNFNVETTRREDLEVLFKDYGRLIRVDMRRNYAFVQFESTEEATKAKEATDGGKLDDNILSVEYVVSKRREGFRRGRYRSPGRGRHDDYRGSRDYGRGRRDRSRSPYGRRGRYRSRSRSPRRRRSRSRSYGRDRDRDRDYRRRSRSYDREPYGRDRDRDRSYRSDDRGYNRQS